MTRSLQSTFALGNLYEGGRIDLSDRLASLLESRHSVSSRRKLPPAHRIKISVPFIMHSYHCWFPNGWRQVRASK